MHFLSHLSKSFFVDIGKRACYNINVNIHNIFKERMYQMNFSRLDQYLSKIPDCGIPGCDLAVTYKGQQIYRGSAGFSDTQGTRPVSENDLYYVFSISKITTCVAAMRLVEEGKIGLDDPVSKYLPAYAYLNVKNENGKPVPAKNVMTVRHLFTMTGGLNYDLTSQPLTRENQKPDADTVSFASAIADSPLEFEPGTRFQYSLCHDVLGAVVEVASGMRFADYVQKHIFDPLGMKDSGYHLPDELFPRIAAMYTFTPGIMRATPLPRERYNPYILNDRFDSGGAGLYSSVNDQLKLLTVLACGGKTADGYSLLRPETIRMLQVGQLTEETLPYFWSGRLYGYSWGLCGRVHVNPTVSDSLSPVGEFGWDGAAGAFALVDPENELAFFFAMHVCSCTYAYHVLHPAIKNLVYSALKD